MALYQTQLQIQNLLQAPEQKQRKYLEEQNTVSPWILNKIVTLFPYNSV